MRVGQAWRCDRDDYLLAGVYGPYSYSFFANQGMRRVCSLGDCHEETVSHVDKFLPATGLAASKSQYPPPVGRTKPRTLMVEQLTARHLLTVDVLSDGFFTEFEDGQAEQESSIVSIEPGNDANPSGDSSDACCVQKATLPNSSPWQNPAHPLDVDADDNVTARDALLVANQLNARGAGPLETVDSQAVSSAGEAVLYVDTNGDGQLTVEDFEAIVVYLNAPRPVRVSNVSSEAAGAEPLPQPPQEKLGSSPHVEGDSSNDSQPQEERWECGLTEETIDDGAKDGSAGPEFSMLSSYDSSGSGGGDGSSASSASGCGCSSSSGEGDGCEVGSGSGCGCESGSGSGSGCGSGSGSGSGGGASSGGGSCWCDASESGGGSADGSSSENGSGSGEEPSEPALEPSWEEIDQLPSGVLRDGLTLYMRQMDLAVVTHLDVSTCYDSVWTVISTARDYNAKIKVEFVEGWIWKGSSIYKEPLLSHEQLHWSIAQYIASKFDSILKSQFGEGADSNSSCSHARINARAAATTALRQRQNTVYHLYDTFDEIIQGLYDEETQGGTNGDAQSAWQENWQTKIDERFGTYVEEHPVLRLPEED